MRRRGGGTRLLAVSMATAVWVKNPPCLHPSLKEVKPHHGGREGGKLAKSMVRRAPSVVPSAPLFESRWKLQLSRCQLQMAVSPSSPSPISSNTCSRRSRLAFSHSSLYNPEGGREGAKWKEGMARTGPCIQIVLYLSLTFWARSHSHSIKAQTRRRDQ